MADTGRRCLTVATGDFSIRCDIHGVTVEVSSDSRDVAEVIGRRFAAFPPSTQEPQAQIDVVTSGAPVVPSTSGWRIVHETPSGVVAYDDEADELRLIYGGHATAHCVAGDFVATVEVDRQDGAWLWTATRPLLTVCLLELLKRRGLFAVHAGGAAADGRAVALAGNSGSGKSSTVLALLLAGWSFLGDDILFLRRGPGGLEILGFADEIDASPATFELFPSLGTPDDWPKLEGYAKHQLGPELLRPNATIAVADLAAVVLPRIGDRTELRDAGAEETMLELVPNVLLTEPTAAQAHLDLLGDLVHQSRSYRLTLGPRVDEIPQLLATLL